jgi:glycosyltransferase involved in cell wall biosynthesis
VRILHVNPFFFPYAGGIERRILGLCQQLQARGHEVHVLTGRLPGTPAAEVFEGVPVTRLPSKTYDLYNPPYIRSSGVEEAVRSLKPDVVDFHYRWAPTYTRAMRRVARDLPVVFTFHNTYGEGRGLWGLLSRANDRRFLSFMRSCRAVVCVSGYVRDQVVAHGFPAERTRVVYNGVDRTTDEELARLRASGGPDEAPYCIFVGRLVGIKGVDVLIDAAASTDARVRFKVVGKGPALDKLKEAARRRGVAERFDFLGYLQEGEKRRLIARAAVMTHPARFEASAVILYEALDLACPVIATRTGGSPEIVGDAGELVSLESPRELAGAIDRLLASRERRDALASRARERSRLFTWPGIAAEMEEVYEAAAARPP